MYVQGAANVPPLTSSQPQEKEDLREDSTTYQKVENQVLSGNEDENSSLEKWRCFVGSCAFGTLSGSAEETKRYVYSLSCGPVLSLFLV